MFTNGVSGVSGIGSCCGDAGGTAVVLGYGCVGADVIMVLSNRSPACLFVATSCDNTDKIVPPTPHSPPLFPRSGKP